jgi:hypothetical protein
MEINFIEKKKKIIEKKKRVFKLVLIKYKRKKNKFLKGN